MKPASLTREEELVQKNSIKVLNPVDGSVVGSVPRATKEDITDIVKKSLKAAREWKAVPVYRRAELMYEYAAAIRSSLEQLAQLQCSEMGKRITECRREIVVSTWLFESYAERIKHLYSEVIPPAQPGVEKDVIYTVREPIGPVACIVPFNYPSILFSHKVAPAIAAGNPVIVKPPSSNPLAVQKLIEIAEKIDFPENLLQFVSGSGAEVGQWLVSNPDIAAVSLTGSTEVGIEIMQTAAPNLHRVFLELGGNDAFIVHDDADLELAVKEALSGRLQNAGQTCNAPKRFIVHESIEREFTAGLIEKLEKIKIGDPADESSDLGCLINSSALNTALQQLDICVKEGCKLEWGGTAISETFFKPAVLTNVSPDSSVATNMEIFAPVFPVIKFKTDEEAIRIANNTQYGLCGGVFSRDIPRAMKTISAMDCGCTVINGSGTYRTIDMPFGGYKKSGIGREGILNTLDEMSQLKTIVIKGVL